LLGFGGGLSAVFLLFFYRFCGSCDCLFSRFVRCKCLEDCVLGFLVYTMVVGRIRIVRLVEYRLLVHLLDNDQRFRGIRMAVIFRYNRDGFH
jgi:hypothetical protein